MSIEIPGSDNKTTEIAGEAGMAGARAIRTEGVEAGTAFTYGSRAGIHAAEILLLALRGTGDLLVEAIDFDALKDEISKIEEQAGITGRMSRLRNLERSHLGR